MTYERENPPYRKVEPAHGQPYRRATRLEDEYHRLFAIAEDVLLVREREAAAGPATGSTAPYRNQPPNSQRSQRSNKTDERGKRRNA